MKISHTSDGHLGKKLENFTRYNEQKEGYTQSSKRIYLIR
jgi:DNA repair exonuclease SbcCD nuclease subunit